MDNLNRFNTSLGAEYQPLVIREVPPLEALGWFTAAAAERPAFADDSFAFFATSAEAYADAVQQRRIGGRVQGSGPQADTPRVFVFTSHVDDPIAARTGYNNDTPPDRLFRSLSAYGENAAIIAHVCKALAPDRPVYDNRTLYETISEHAELGYDPDAMDTAGRTIFDEDIAPVYAQQGVSPERVNALLAQAKASNKQGVIVALSWSQLRKAGVSIAEGDPGEEDCSLLAPNGLPLWTVVAAIPVTEADGLQLESQLPPQPGTL